ncbi:hypothetical protein ACJMK2_030406, partial [Sinanodonta woodiana]
MSAQVCVYVSVFSLNDKIVPTLMTVSSSSSVFFDYNKIATYNDIGMDCRVSDPEERSSIRIHQGNREMVSITPGCSIKSNDSRLRISCIETEDVSSDLGTWNCSDGKSYDTVTFHYSIQEAYLSRQQQNVTFSCTVYKDCILSSPFKLWHIFPDYVIQRIDGRAIRCMDSHAHFFLNCTLTEIQFSDAGIYYILEFGFMAEAAFIVQVRDYPTQPVITAQTLSSTSDQGLFELICSSESRTQPVFSRNRLSYHWKVNQLNIKDIYTCYRMKGPVLTLCSEPCRLKDNARVSVTCTVYEDGLISKESEPFIIMAVTPLVPVEQPVSTTQVSVSADNQGNRTQVCVSAEHK